MEESVRSEYSSYAAEGTLAHEFAELELLKLNREISNQQYNRRIAKLRKSDLYTDEMEGFVHLYVSYVMSHYKETKEKDPNTIMSVEERLDFSKYVPDAFGTGDTVIVGNRAVQILDLKYGKGVQVSAYENSQLKLYGLGAYLAYFDFFDIDVIQVHIGQPRLGHFESFDITVEDLLGWAEEVSVRAQMAHRGEGEPIAGKWCRWCKVKARCTAFSGKKFEEAVNDFKLSDPRLLTDEQLMRIYSQIADLKDWVKSVDSYVKEQARLGNIKHPGYKLVYATAKRKWLNEEDVIDTLEGFGYSRKDLVKEKIRGILDIEQLVSKDFFENNISHLVIKPQGAPTLVPEDDPRNEIGGLQSAIEDFS